MEHVDVGADMFAKKSKPIINFGPGPAKLAESVGDHTFHMYLV
jgi:hypothetical protein